jgi:protein-L-isoaspartate(D-aspartate) O-methyltransferase
MHRTRRGFTRLLVSPMTTLLIAEDPTATKRERMVSAHIESRGIRDSGVLRAMRRTPRHLFVPEESRHRAYDDYPLPIGHGATISQPYIVALMTELLQAGPGHKVLEIGAGSGYQAAVLAQLASHVYSIELEPELARLSAATLRLLGYENVTVRQGDGYLGWPEQAPFDRIIVTAAPPRMPQRLIAQLARGGRLVAPVGGSADQELVVLEKLADGKIRTTTAGAVIFVPMRPAPKP